MEAESTCVLIRWMYSWKSRPQARESASLKGHRVCLCEKAEKYIKFIWCRHMVAGQRVADGKTQLRLMNPSHDVDRVFILKSTFHLICCRFLLLPRLPSSPHLPFLTVNCPQMNDFFWDSSWNTKTTKKKTLKNTRTIKVIPDLCNTFPSLPSQLPLRQAAVWTRCYI